MNNYDDIIDYPYSGIKTRQPMPLESRAAQFAPFAALHGHEEAIEETARENIEEYNITSVSEIYIEGFRC